MKNHIGTFIKRNKTTGPVEQDCAENSGVNISNDVKISNCPQCSGKTILEIADCEYCSGGGRIIEFDVEENKLTQEDIDSEYTLFEEKNSSNNELDKELTNEELETLGSAKTSTLPGAMNSGGEGSGAGGAGGNSGAGGAGGGPPDQKEKKESLLKKIIGWIVQLLLLYLLFTLLVTGCDFLREKKKEKIEDKKKMEEEAQKKKKINDNKKRQKEALQKRKHDEDSPLPRKSGHGPNYNFAPIEVWQNYGNMNIETLRSNKGLNRFMQKNFKKGKLKKNRELLSEKGIKHLCRDFGKYESDCNKKWFKNRKIRQTFVDKVEQLYRREGSNAFD